MSRGAETETTAGSAATEDPSRKGARYDDGPTGVVDPSQPQPAVDQGV